MNYSEELRKRLEEEDIADWHGLMQKPEVIWALLREIDRLNAELLRFVWWVYQVYARNVQELTSGITEACTYETEEKAEKGKYGLPIRCWKYIRYLEEYTAGIYNGTYLDSETSTGVKRDLSDAEIEELGAQEAEKRGEK